MENLCFCDIDENRSLNFVKNNTIYIQGNFDNTIDRYVLPFFLELVMNKSISAIQILICSDGGSIDHLKKLLALIEIAKNKSIRIETYVFARAYSCGSMLACAGTKGFRYISRYAEHLCHLGGFAMGDVYNDKELERSQERVKSHFDFVRGLYSKYATIKNLEEVIQYDNYFIRNTDIIENGLADKIVDN